MMNRCSLESLLTNPFSLGGGDGNVVLEAKSGRIRPKFPFSCWYSIPTNAIIFGSICGVQRLSSKSLEIIRGQQQQQDIWNDAFGFVIMYQYYHYFFLGSTDQHRLIRHNRVVGGAVVVSILYANILV
jgi:hypothetical protein